MIDDRTNEVPEQDDRELQESAYECTLYPLKGKKQVFIVHCSHPQDACDVALESKGFKSLKEVDQILIKHIK